jgi:hypothetical protein
MRKYDAALTALEPVRRIGDSLNEFKAFANLLVHASEKAAAWNQSLDPYERRRRADQNFLTSTAPSIVKKLDKVCHHAAGHITIFWPSSAVRRSGISQRITGRPSKKLSGHTAPLANP